MSHDQTIATTLELLTKRFPACFSIYEKRRRPLKIGIHTDILAALDGAVAPADLGRALRCYTANKVYRNRLIAGAARIGLDGKPAGVVTENEAARPAAANPPIPAPPAEPTRPIPSTPIPTPAPTKTTASATPRRLSLADLRAAAAPRKEATAS